MTERTGRGNSDGAKRESNSKVARVIHKYDLGELGDELVEYWTGDATENRSLRELADYFNRQILARTLRNASPSTLDGEPANFYRLLTDEEVSSGATVQATDQLEQRGIDVDQLMADFVSRQAIHTYLTTHRGVSYSTDETDPVETERTNIERLKRRTTTIIESKIDRLRKADRITLGEFDVLIDVRVLCEDCGAQYSAIDLLVRGACDCSDRSP